MKSIFLYLILFIGFEFCSPFQKDDDSLLGTKFEGMASYYGPKFHGKTTANGERMHQDSLTCAHKNLPFGTMLEVRNKRNDSTVVVRVNDRGPYSKSRVIDVSTAAAKQLKMRERGVISVAVTVIGENGQVFIRPAQSIMSTFQREMQNIATSMN